MRTKHGGKAYAACSLHLGFALRHVTEDGAADVRVMNVRGSSSHLCKCKKPAVFYVYETECAELHARDLTCPHGYTRADTCPGCDADEETRVTAL